MRGAGAGGNNENISRGVIEMRTCSAYQPVAAIRPPNALML